MRSYLAEEFVAQKDFIFEPARKQALIRVSRVPDARFAHEIKARVMRDQRFLRLGVASEENGCSEDALKGRNQAAVLRAALLHAEGVQHFRGALENDGLPPLPKGRESPRKGEQADLAPRAIHTWDAPSLAAEIGRSAAHATACPASAA